MRKVFFDLVPVLYVILFFGGSIFAHELGHYLAAKKRGLFVPKFSIGIGPKLFGMTIGKTEFVVSLFPIGGYVSIPQLDDLNATEGTDSTAKNLKAASCWDKIVTAFAGPFFNILFAIVIAIAVYFIGIPTAEESLCTNVGYVPQTLTLAPGREIPSPAYEAGILPNDKILSIDGHRVKKFNEILEFIALGNRKDKDGHPLSAVEIERNGQILSLAVRPAMLSPYSLNGDNSNEDKLRMIGIWPKQNLIVEKLHAATAAKNFDLRKGDRVISANGTPLFNWMELRDIAKEAESIALAIERDGKQQILQIPVTRLAILKPHLNLKFANGAELDVIPEGPLYAFNTGEERFINLQIFSSNRSFLKQYELAGGESIISVNGEKIESLHYLQKVALEFPRLIVQVLAEPDKKTIELDHISETQVVDTVFSNFLGIIGKENIIIDHPTPLAQIADITVLTFKTLGSLFSRTSDISTKHLMGPAGMIKTMYSSAKTSFPWLLWLVVLININLAILNLLPFPVFDGGLITIAALEKISGWKFINKVLAKVQIACFAILIALIAYVTFLDVRRMWTKNCDSLESVKQSHLAITYGD
ncbi:MAG: RIP metalloprotease RseP [Puniceicoccales bacterium]|jgi:RIP metalloprotease RseP|nr:RIP metalloprotease RseP [Puniceicoccales bacterium]